jgi:hypothetical protein
MLGSVAQIFPGLPAGSEILACALTLLAGFGAVFWLSRFETKKSA